MHVQCYVCGNNNYSDEHYDAGCSTFCDDEGCKVCPPCPVCRDGGGRGCDHCDGDCIVCRNMDAHSGVCSEPWVNEWFAAEGE